jgi:pyruvate dehydrogenase E2 component (dihydrolipoamide acetyltransferase)
MSPEINVAFRSLGGVGEDVLLIHGLASDRLSWAANAPALMRGFRVHSLDLPGHGETQGGVGDGSIALLSDVVRATLARNGIIKTHIVGHSLGGAIALAMAAGDPAIVRSLALIAPVGLGHGIDRGYLRDLIQSTDPEITLILLRRLFVKKQLVGKIQVKRLLDHLATGNNREQMLTMVEALGTAEAREVPDLVPRVPGTLPKLLIWGQDDVINRPSDTLASRLGVIPEFISGSGHLPHVENMESFNLKLFLHLKAASDRRLAR